MRFRLVGCELYTVEHVDWPSICEAVVVAWSAAVRDPGCGRQIWGGLCNDSSTIPWTITVHFPELRMPRLRYTLRTNTLRAREMKRIEGERAKEGAGKGKGWVQEGERERRSPDGLARRESERRSMAQRQARGDPGSGVDGRVCASVA